MIFWAWYAMDVLALLSSSLAIYWQELSLIYLTVLLWKDSSVHSFELLGEKVTYKYNATFTDHVKQNKEVQSQ